MMTVTALEILLLTASAALMAHEAGAQQLPKCELKSQLQAFLTNSSQETDSTAQDLVAKFVCKAEVTTAFNSSAVTHVEMKVNPGHSFPRRKPPVPLRGRGRGPRGGQSDSESHEDSEESMPVQTLYGVFQLPVSVACANGSSTSSLNICQMDCAQLIDHDTTDDIACLWTLISHNERDDDENEDDKVGPRGGSIPFKRKLKNQIFPKECTRVTPSVYFSECT